MKNCTQRPSTMIMVYIISFTRFPIHTISISLVHFKYRSLSTCPHNVCTNLCNYSFQTQNNSWNIFLFLWLQKHLDDDLLIIAIDYIKKDYHVLCCQFAKSLIYVPLYINQRRNNEYCWLTILFRYIIK